MGLLKVHNLKVEVHNLKVVGVGTFVECDSLV